MRKLTIPFLMYLLSFAFIVPASAARKDVLPNGMTVVTAGTEGDIVSIRLFIRSPHLSGQNKTVFNLTAGMLLKGTVEADAEKFNGMLEDNGIEMSAAVSDDYVLLSARTLKENACLAADMMRQALLSPSLEESVLKNEITLALRGLEAAEDNPMEAGLAEIYRRTYGRHPYAVNRRATAALLRRITVTDIRNALKRWYRPERAVLSVCGDVDALHLADRVSDGWVNYGIQRPGSQHVTTIRLRSSAKGKHHLDKDIQGTWIFMAYDAPPADSRDYAAMKILDSVIGGGMDSRLFGELRERRGLAYETASFYSTRQLGSRAILYIGTAPERAQEAEQAMLDLVEKVKLASITYDEMQRAKAYLHGVFMMAQERSADKAFYRGWFETIGLGYNFVDRYPCLLADVTLSDIQRAARRYMQDPLIVAIGPSFISSGGAE